MTRLIRSILTRLPPPGRKRETLVAQVVQVVQVVQTCMHLLPPPLLQHLLVNLLAAEVEMKTGVEDAPICGSVDPSASHSSDDWTS